MHRIAPRALRATFCTALATALCVPVSSAATETYYTLTLENVLISGHQTSSAAKGEQIEIHSFQWGPASQGAGSGGGKAKFNEFIIKQRAPPTSADGGVSVAAGDVTGDGTAAPRKPTIGRSTISPKSLPGSGGSAGANETLAVGSNQTESGLPTGKRQHKPFTMTQPLDKGSITVRMRTAGTCTVGKRYAGAQFSASGKTYVLSDLQVADCGDTSAGPTEEITFVYGKLIVRGWDPEKKEQ